MKKITSFLLILLLSIPAYGIEIQETIARQGYKIWLVEDHSLPIITARITFKNAGSAHDAPNKAGTAYMLSSMLTEGAGSLNNLQFNKRLEDLAIHLDFDVDNDNFYITIKTLQKNREQAFELLSLALTQPLFDSLSIKRIQKQTLSSIEKSGEDPYYLAEIEWNKRIFGSHPYSIPTKGTAKTINAITRNDLLEFMRENLISSNMLISVAGDIDKHSLANLLEKHLGGIPTASTGHSAAEVKKFDSFPNGSTYNISSSNPQSIAIFGHKGIGYHDPDFYPAYILNHILGGGGFQSRLVDEVREKKGLAYSVNTHLDPLAKAALFKGSVGTRNAQIDRSIAIIKEQMLNLRKNGITEKELEATKSYLIGSFPLKMTSSNALVTYLNFIQMENLGIDFIEKRNQYVSAVTLDDVNRIAAKLLDPDKLVTVIVGKR